MLSSDSEKLGRSCVLQLPERNSHENLTHTVTAVCCDAKAVSDKGIIIDRYFLGGDYLIISKRLPPVPDNGGKSNFVLFFYRGQYYMTCFDHYSRNVYPNLSIPGNNSYCYILSKDETEWTLIHSNGGFHCPASSMIATSETVYSSDGGIYLRGSGDPLFYEQATVIGDNITSSNIYGSVFGETLKLVPIVIVALVLLIAFRKAWAFLSGVVRGA